MINSKLLDALTYSKIPLTINNDIHRSTPQSGPMPKQVVYRTGQRIAYGGSVWPSRILRLINLDKAISAVYLEVSKEVLIMTLSGEAVNLVGLNLLTDSDEVATLHLISK